MVLSRYRIAILAASMFAVAARAADRVVEAVDGFVDRCIAFVVAAFRIDAPRLAIDGPAFTRSIDRQSLAPSLLERLRHEKGVPRLGAARGI